MNRSDTWNTLKKYGINPRRIPNDIAEKAVEVIADLEQTGNPWKYDSERMKWDRDVVSVHIHYRWRLLIEVRGDLLTITGLYSHEDYNRLAAGR